MKLHQFPGVCLLGVRLAPLLSRLGTLGEEQLGEVLASKVDNLFAEVRCLSGSKESVVAAGLRGHLESAGVFGLQRCQGLGKKGLASVFALRVLCFL